MTTYLKIIAGNFAQTVSEDILFAVKRDSKNPKTGEEKVVYERYFSNWTGKIKNITFEEKSFGRLCVIETEGGEVSFYDGNGVRKEKIDQPLSISLLTSTKYFSSFAESILAADLSKLVKLHPYDMGVDDKGKKKVGMSVQQGGVKLSSPFWTKDGKRTPDFPQVDQAMTEKKGYWTMYYGGVEDFLCEKLSQLESSPVEEVEAKDLPWEQDIKPDF